MKGILWNIAGLGILIFLLNYSLGELNKTVTENQNHSADSEVLYLPNGKGLNLISLGYTNVLSDLLWFNTISYFGKHYSGNRNYRWLGHMCDLVTDLNTSATHVFQFCGMMLAWEGNQPEQAIKILSKSIQYHPNDWFFRYLRGFTYSFFLHRDDLAKDDFVASAALPGAHPMVIRLASKNILSLNTPEEAIRFLEDMIGKDGDRNSNSALVGRLQDAYFELHFSELEEARDKFKSQFERFPISLEELASQVRLDQDLVSSRFSDPFGGTYRIDSKTGEITSSSKRKRVSMYKERRYEATK